MGLLGFVLGKVVILGAAATVGFITGGPVGAGIAVSQASVAAHSVALAGALAPL